MLDPYEKNNVNLDQLLFQKSADQDQHCFQFACKYMLIPGIMSFTLIKIGKVCRL